MSNLQPTERYEVISVDDYGELAAILEDAINKSPTSSGKSNRFYNCAFHVCEWELEDPEFIDGSSTEGLVWPEGTKAIILYMAHESITNRHHTHREVMGIYE